MNEGSIVTRRLRACPQQHWRAEPTPLSQHVERLLHRALQRAAGRIAARGRRRCSRGLKPSCSLEQPEQLAHGAVRLVRAARRRRAGSGRAALAEGRQGG
ncbi:MAG: hypothetical protein MZW92_57180 [Comamonadaceae bacterium]|nr:hypothetical protein [Comamonadaceae bacterium]